MNHARAEQVQRMIKIAEHLYVPRVHQAYGDVGIAHLRRLLLAIRELFHWTPCESFTGGLTVYVDLADVPAEPWDGGAITAAEHLATAQLREATMRVEMDGRFKVWSPAVDPTFMPPDTISYRFQYIDHLRAGEEYFRVESQDIPVLNPTGFPSAFAVPTFDDLVDALERYGDFNRSPDPHLSLIWRQEDKRLGLINRPEKHMRRSLESYLRYALRDAKILLRPEQNVNETEPVDIEVTWAYQGRLAWIEIKWLGDSAPRDATDHWSTSYTESRAIAGARQLANYLDSGATRVTIPFMGYLVVFDGRRRGLAVSDTTISRESGMFYQFRDVTYPPEILDRRDMASPIRYFLPPIC